VEDEANIGGDDGIRYQKKQSTNNGGEKYGWQFER